jgi:hypothetical protein
MGPNEYLFNVNDLVEDAKRHQSKLNSDGNNNDEKDEGTSAGGGVSKDKEKEAEVTWYVMTDMVFNLF